MQWLACLSPRACCRLSIPTHPRTAHWDGVCKGLGGLVPSHMQRLSRREIRGVPSDKIFSSDVNIRREIAGKLICRNKQGLELFHQRHQLLSGQMQRWGTQGASVVYTMYHENLDFVRWAKKQGLRSVVDVFISPSTSEVMKQEYAVFSRLWNR